MRLLVGLGAPDGDADSPVFPGEIGDVEGYEFGAASGERHPKGDQRPVAQRGQVSPRMEPSSWRTMLGIGGIFAAGSAGA